MRRCSPWVVSIVGVLAMCGAVRAQEAPPPTGTTAAESIPLAHKFRAGTVSRLRFSSTGTVMVDLNKILPPGMPSGVPGVIPTDFTAQYDVLQTVKNVASDGSATVTFRLDNLLLKGTIREMEMTARLQGGKLTFTRDGEAYRPLNVPPGNPFANKTVEARISPTGQVLQKRGSLLLALHRYVASDGPMNFFKAAFLMPETELLVFPGGEVTVGQAWEEPRSLQQQFAGLEPDGSPTPETSVRITNTLKELQKRGPRRIAVIAVKSSTNASDGTSTPITGTNSARARGLSASLSGTHLFDVTAGELRMGEFRVKMGGQGAPSTDGELSLLDIDADVNLKVALQPQAAAGSKPATRRSRGRR